MPRDGSGIYTLPAGNPVVTNTIIASAWANNTLSDIAAQLNNVFTRDGLLGPTAPFKVVDGTVNAPGLAWNAEPGLGWYRPGTNKLSFATAGTTVFSVDNSIAAQGYVNFAPRSQGLGRLGVFNNSIEAANKSGFYVESSVDGNVLFSTVAIGTGVLGHMIFQSKSDFLFKPIAGSANLGCSMTLEAQANGPTQIFLKKKGSQGSHLWGMQGESTRWLIMPGDSAAETGGNTGSNFIISRYGDNGIGIDAPLTINRASGLVGIIKANISNGLNVQGGFGYQGGVTGSGGLNNTGELNNDGWIKTTGTFWATSLQSGGFGLRCTGYTTNGDQRFMGVFNCGDIGDTLFSQAYHRPGVETRYRVVLGGGNSVFDMKNNGQGESTAGWIAVSDRRAKTNFRVIQDAMAKLRAITGYVFDRLDVHEMDGSVVTAAGLVAQEVQAVLPQSVPTTFVEDNPLFPDGKRLSLDHMGPIALLVNAVKELDERIAQLEAV